LQRLHGATARLIASVVVGNGVRDR
jgi:hypothetical protein